ncbi:MAG TPA: ATP-dependent DNA ligase [Candidatus Nitrosopolaris sp.]|nr:ATP-dependent DNA ligase [Candidatus Nitrosopolaris sp.]
MYFSYLVDIFEQMEQTTSRLILTDYLVSLFKKTPAKIIDKVAYLIQSKLHPDYEGIELGIAEKMALRALSLSSGAEMASILELYRKAGDIGDIARELMSSKKSIINRSSKKMMTVECVYSTLDKIARTTGPGSQELKIRNISSLLNDSTPREARYIMKFVLGTLRLGIAEFTILDALAVTFTRDKSNREILENAYNVSSDLGTVSKILATKGIDAVKSIKISLYKPIRPMLAERVRAAQEALERMGGIAAAAEYKLDGERVQIHKGKEKKVELFSRRLEKITHHYPDIVKEINNSLKVEEAILEGEVVAINPQTSEFLPFQELMHRRRKHKVQEAMEGYPVVVNIFDVLFVDGVDKTSLPYSQRRGLLEKLTRRLKENNNMNNYMIRLVPQTVVKDSEQIEKFMASAIESGCEGLMIKQLTSPYRAGAREYFWVKLKREYRSELVDTLDLVIVGALYGRGRRVGKYGALLLAAYDQKSDMFRTICKVGTGFTDKSLEDFYSSLEKHIFKHKHPRVDSKMETDVWFEPKIVIEIIASEITLSPSHTAGINSIRQSYGLALRFPKFTGKIRDDKNPEDATTVEELISIYKQQIRAAHN